MSDSEQIQSYGRIIAEYTSLKQRMVALRGNLQATIEAYLPVTIGVWTKDPVNYGELADEAEQLVPLVKFSAYLREAGEVARRMGELRKHLAALGIETTEALLEPFRKE